MADDPYRKLASLAFGVDEADVTRLQRQYCKYRSFTYIYGQVFEEDAWHLLMREAGFNIQLTDRDEFFRKLLE